MTRECQNHVWHPVDGMQARYRCGNCPSWGRKTRAGLIVVMKAPPVAAATKSTVKPLYDRGGVNVGGNLGNTRAPARRGRR